MLIYKKIFFLMIAFAISKPALALNLSILSQTGLYADINHFVLAEGVLEYNVQFPLYSDGLLKRTQNKELIKYMESWIRHLPIKE